MIGYLLVHLLRININSARKARLLSPHANPVQDPSYVFHVNYYSGFLINGRPASETIDMNIVWPRRFAYNDILSSLKRAYLHEPNPTKRSQALNAQKCNHNTTVELAPSK